MHHYLVIIFALYTGWPQKIGTIFVRLNFIEYKPIYEIISLSESEENL